MSRGGWTRDDHFVCIPYVDPTTAEKLFRHKVFEFLLREELISLESVERRRDRAGLVGGVETDTVAQEAAPSATAASLHKRWADLLRRVYEVDPLVCPRCSAAVRVLGVHHQARDHRPHSRPPATSPHVTPEVPPAAGAQIPAAVS